MVLIQKLLFVLRFLALWYISATIQASPITKFFNFESVYLDDTLIISDYFYFKIVIHWDNLRSQKCEALHKSRNFHEYWYTWRRGNWVNNYFLLNLPFSNCMQNMVFFITTFSGHYITFIFTDLDKDFHLRVYTERKKPFASWNVTKFKNLLCFINNTDYQKITRDISFSKTETNAQYIWISFCINVKHLVSKKDQRKNRSHNYRWTTIVEHNSISKKVE